MLIACITGPDFPSVKKQLEKAHALCDAVEIRSDLLEKDLDLPPIHLPIIDCSEIPSYHNYEETPKDLDALLASMPKENVVKIATMANCITDSLRMLDLVRRHRNVAGMCMGPYGAITRILAPIYGSLMTFASVGNPAAPGQLDAEELIERYRFKKLSPSTKVFGLIGNPVSQSPSHITHNAHFQNLDLDAVYVKMKVQEEELPLFFDLVKRLDFKGLSVTIPHKEKMFPFVDQVEEKAQAIGAINTLTFGNEIIGANTDADGALDVLEKRIPILGKKVVILGAGGSAKAVAYEAKRRGAEVTLCSRRFGNLDQIPPYEILINTIPVDVDHDPIPGSIIYDINFNRKNCPLMERARAKNCKLIFGEEMFQAQAAMQFARWSL